MFKPVSCSCFGLKMGFLSAHKYYLIFIELSGKKTLFLYFNKKTVNRRKS